MASKELQIVISARDNASSVIDRVEKKVAGVSSAGEDVAKKRNADRVDANWDQAAFQRFKDEEKRAAEAAKEGQKIVADARRQAMLEKERATEDSIKEYESRERAARTKREKFSEVAGGGSGGLFASAKDANKLARSSGELAFERILKGGGQLALVTFALDAFSKSLQAGAEALNKFESGELSARQATGAFLENSRNAIPVMSEFGKAFDTIRDAGEDMVSVLAKEAGASANVVDMIKSETTRRKEAEEAAKRQKEALDGLHQSMTEARKLGTNDAGRSRIDEEEKYNKTLNGLQTRMNAAQKSHQDDRHVIIAEAQREIELEKRNHIARLRIIEEEANQAELNRLHQHTQAIINAHGAASESQMKNAGLDADAANAQAKREYDQTVADAASKRDALTVKDPQRAAQYQKEYEQDVAAAGDRMVGIQRDANQKTKEQQEQFELDQTEIESKAAVDRLRLLGRDDEARLLELRAGQNRELAQLDAAEKVKEQAAANAGKGAGDAEYDRNRAMYEARRKAMVEANAAQTAEEQKQIAQKDRDRAQDASANVDKLLMQNEIDQLKQAGELGDHNAEIEAKKIEYLQRQAEKRAEIVKAMRDENHVLTAGQKAALESQLKAIEDQTKKGLADIEKPKRPDLASARGLAPQFEEDTGNTGALAEQQAEVIANQSSHDDKLADINAGIGDIFQAIGSDGWLADALKALLASGGQGGKPVFG